MNPIRALEIGAQGKGVASAYGPRHVVGLLIFVKRVSCPQSKKARCAVYCSAGGVNTSRSEVQNIKASLPIRLNWGGNQMRQVHTLCKGRSPYGTDLGTMVLQCRERVLHTLRTFMSTHVLELGRPSVASW